MEETSEISLSEPDKPNEVSTEEPETVQVNGTDKESSDNNDLAKKLEEFEITVSHLREEVIRKTSVINDLEKQRGSLEKDVTHVSSCLLATRFDDNFDQIPVETRSRKCCHPICDRRAADPRRQKRS